MIMLVLRFQPVGKKHQRSFRLVVDERRHKLGGKNVEDLGWLNPHDDKFEFKKERVLHWLSVGAKASDTVHNALVRAGILNAAKRAVHAKPKMAAGENPAPIGARAGKPVSPEAAAGASAQSA